MSEQFVKFFESEHLRTLEERIRRKMLDEALRDASSVLLNFVRASIRFRAFRTGALQRSPEEAFAIEKLRGAATLFTLLFYAKWVEWGTGRRGAESGVTPPPGYVYGPRPGMAARYPFHLALRDARPAIIQVFERHARELR